MERAFYTADEVAEIIGISKAMVYKTKDSIPHRRFGKRIVFPKAQFHAWINKEVV